MLFDLKLAVKQTNKMNTAVKAFLDENINLEQYNDLITNEYEQTNTKFNDIFKDINLRQKIMKAKIPPRDPRKFHLGEYCVVGDISHDVNYDMGSSFARNYDQQYEKYLEWSGSSLYWDNSVGFRPKHKQRELAGVAVLKIDREKGKIKYCKMECHGDHWEHQRASTTSLWVRDWCSEKTDIAGKVAHKHIYADRLYPMGMTKDEFIAYRKSFKE